MLLLLLFRLRQLLFGCPLSEFDSPQLRREAVFFSRFVQRSLIRDFGVTEEAKDNQNDVDGSRPVHAALLLEMFPISKISLSRQ